ALRFVGGGWASTAGGIKVTTLAVMVLAIIAEARGDTDIEAFGRRLDPSVVRLAIAVAVIGATMVGIATLALLLTTDLHLNVVLFEVISAFATSGLSTGITAGLPASAKYILLGLMFAGRVGTITLAAALALRHRRRIIRLPKERPIVGETDAHRSVAGRHRTRYRNGTLRGGHRLVSGRRMLGGASR